MQNDKKILKNSSKELCASCSENNFVIDVNESSGYVELNFTGINLFGRVKIVEVILNVSDVEWAESGNGFAVFFKNEKIGSIGSVYRNSSTVVKLNISKIAENKSIKLVLKANGDDGLYILSKKSGFGAILKLQY